MEKKRIKKLITQGNIDEAVELCLKVYKNSPQENIAISISARYNDLRKRELTNTYSHDQINLERDRIAQTILELIKEKKKKTGFSYLFLVIGIFLTAGIISYLIFINFIRLDTQGKFCDPNDPTNYFGIEDQPHLFVKDPQSIEAPIENNKAFQLISDDRYIDGRKHVTNSYEFTRWDRNITIVKKKDANIFKVGFLGGDIRFCKCDSIKKITYYYRSNAANDKIMKTWQVWFDVSRKPIESPVVLKFHTLYYRPFHEYKGVDMMMYGKFEKISMNLIFDYPALVGNFYTVISNEKKEVYSFRDSIPPPELRDLSIDILNPPEGKMLVVNWAIEDPGFPFTYNLSWEPIEEALNGK